jgi:hypothetical protein
MKSILKAFLAVSAALAAVSCGPSKYMMHLEMRYPSKAGIELAGKNVSVVYLENGKQIQDGFNASMAEGLAYTIENDYGTGEGSVGIYRMTRSASGDYSSKDTLTNLLIDTGADVVFLLDTVKLGEMTVGGPSKVAYKTVKDSSVVNVGSVPFTVKIYAYDAMNKQEEIKSFGGTSVAQASVYSAGNLTPGQLRTKAYEVLPSEGFSAGELVGASFKSQWKVEGYSVAYFDSSKWIKALEKADQLDWKGAMDIWFELLETNDVMKRSCASYNIALACYMLGDYKLAEDWLDLSDKETELPMSVSLRKRIDSRK